MGAQARGPRLVGAHATRSGREKIDYFSIIFDYFSAAPPPNLVGGGARTNFSIRGRLKVPDAAPIRVSSLRDPLHLTNTGRDINVNGISM